MKLAVCLLVAFGDGTYLAVSRRNDTTRWGLPGGKVDLEPGETCEEAVIRETAEEIGLRIGSALELIPLYAAACPGKGPDDTYWAVTYLWQGKVELAELRAEEGLEIRTLCEPALTDPRT